MCRLAYFKNPTPELLNNLTSFLSYLEIKRGGHGNGVGALIKKNNKKVFWIRKGLGYSVYMAANDIEKILTKAINGVFFHTRLASIGKITSKLNHPFATKNLMLIHNGADAGKTKIVTEMLKYNMTLPKLYNDTLLLTKLLNKYYEYVGSEELTAMYAFNIINPVNAVFIQFYKTGNVYLIVKQQDFQLYFDEKTVIAASEGLDDYFDEIYTCNKCIVKVTKNSVELIYGKLALYEGIETIEINYEVPLDYYYYYSKKLWKEKEYM